MISCVGQKMLELTCELLSGPMMRACCEIQATPNCLECGMMLKASDIMWHAVWANNDEYTL